MQPFPSTRLLEYACLTVRGRSCTGGTRVFFGDAGAAKSHRPEVHPARLGRPPGHECSAAVFPATEVRHVAWQATCAALEGRPSRKVTQCLLSQVRTTAY